MEKIKEYLDYLIAASTPEHPVWNIESILEKKDPHWNYIDGCMCLAILYMYQATKEEKYFTFLKDFFDFYIDNNGEILGYQQTDFSSDNINEGKLLFFLYEKTKESKYKKALDTLYEQIKWQPRTKEKSFWHKLIYPYQVWLDGLYMVMPFYLEYDLKFGDKEYTEDILLQFKNVDYNMKDSKTGLFYHGYDESRLLFWSDNQTGLSKNFWSRSLGWYSMALVDSLEILKENQFLQTSLKELLDSVLQFQDEKTKLFYQVTNLAEKKDNYLETSGSCALAYTLMKGYRLGFLEKEYYDKGEEILNQVVKLKLVATENAFTLKDICLVAGLGGMAGKGNYPLRDGSYEYYISEPKVENDAKGVAPLLFAYTEYLKHNK